MVLVCHVLNLRWDRSEARLNGKWVGAGDHCGARWPSSSVRVVEVRSRSRWWRRLFLLLIPSRGDSENDAGISLMCVAWTTRGSSRLRQPVADVASRVDP